MLKIKQKPKIAPFKGTKFDDKITYPVKTTRMEKKLADLDKFKDKAEAINERKQIVEDRLQQKQQFKDDVDEIMNNGDLVRDLTHYDADSHELYKKPQSLTRK